MTEVSIKQLRHIFLLHLFNASFTVIHMYAQLLLYRFTKHTASLHLTSEYLKKSQISKEQDFIAKPSFHLVQKTLNLIKPM